MTRILMLRALVTLLTFLAWAAVLGGGSGATFGYDIEPVDNDPHLFAITHGPYVPLPSGLQEGDRFDSRQFSITERLALYGDTPFVGDELKFHASRGKQPLDLTIAAVPLPPPTPREWVSILVAGLNSLLGLVLLWRGRDWAAWGLSLLLLGLSLRLVIIWIPGESGFGKLVANAVLIPVAIAGLYLAVRSLTGNSLPRILAIASLASVATIIGAVVVLRVHHELAWALTGRWFGTVAVGRAMVPVAMAVCLLALGIGYRHADAAPRLRIRWVLAAALLQALAWAMYPAFEDSAVARQLVSGTLEVLATACFIYALLRHHLVDLSFVISRTLVYSALVAAVVGAFAAIEHAVVTEAIGRRAGIVLQLLVPMAVGLLLHRVRMRIERVVERLFFRRQFAAQQALERLSEESQYMERSDRLIAHALDEVYVYLGPARVAIYLREGSGYGRRSQLGAPEWPDYVDADDPVMVALRATRNEQNLAERRSAIGPSGRAFPMAVAADLHGALVCGERPQDYTPIERRLLMRVARDVGQSLRAIQLRKYEDLLSAIANGTATLREARARVLAWRMPATAEPQSHIGAQDSEDP
jgi:hypothetical protein